MSPPVAGDDAPWPVSARKLLTRREQAMYKCLANLYPSHRIFIQVALSQLIDVDQRHPQHRSIRARYKQLVADFVLCRPDLSVVAVIELDDRTHAWPRRRRADARKTKALADAGIRLVRIPAGALPSEDAVRRLVDDREYLDESDATPSILTVPDEQIRTYTLNPLIERQDRAREESRALNRVLLKIILGGVVIAGGWFLFSQLLPVLIQRAMQPLATVHLVASPAQPRTVAAGIQTQISPAAMSRQAAAELAEKTRAEIQAAADLQRQKAQAWLRFYSPPATCEHPADWSAQVECGNEYMRGKKRFEAQWAADHARNPALGSTIVLDNGSVAGARN